MAAAWDALVAGLKSYRAAKESARKATNAVNREKTQLKKLFLAWAKGPGGPGVEATVRSDDVEARYSVSESECIPPAKWHALLKQRKITEAQFYDCLSVGKADAIKAIGEDQVQALTETVRGTKADIRLTDLDKPVAKPTFTTPKLPATGPGLRLRRLVRMRTKG